MKTAPLLTISASVSALSLALAAPAYAQQSNSASTEASIQSDDFHRSDDIVVTAPFVERLDILSGTSAISGEVLAEKTRAQLGDILTSLPGVSATSFSPGASRPVLRGYQGNRVAALPTALAISTPPTRRRTMR